MDKIREEEIRPKELFDHYLHLSKLDGQKLNHLDFAEISCPACNSKDSFLQFEKDNYKYRECFSCFSLYCSPRPNSEQLGQLYVNSPSSKYWSEFFFPAVTEVRREKLFKPKAQEILQMIHDKDLDVSNICDVGAGHGLLLEELGKLNPKIKLHAVEPDANSAQTCREKDITVLQTLSSDASEWKNKFDLVLSFEVIEHVFSPFEFIESLFNLTKNGGYTLITGLGYEGYDILTLQKHSKSISPPHHINFLSISGFEELFRSVGYSHVAAWTPGKLDVDIVLNSSELNPFAKALQRRGAEALEEFQQFLRKYQLSSHCWILARK